MLPTHRNYTQSTTWKARKIHYSRGLARCISSPRLSFVLLLLTITFVGLFLTSETLPIPAGFDRPFRRPDHIILEAPSYEDGWPKNRRAEAVREAFSHAYRSYEKFAMPMDELKPLTNETVQNLNGWGLTVFDSLDTLWLMDLKPEFDRAARHVSRMKFRQSTNGPTMFFETVIRYLGGLLSAYALSQRHIFLAKADELGRALLPAFNTTSGMPAFAVNLKSGTNFLGPRFGHVVLAEAGSCQMEFKYLAHLTGRSEYFEAVNATMTLMERSQRKNGMWGTTWDIKSGKPVDFHITVGALADSAYEYLLKQYILSGRSEYRLRDMYLKTARGIIHNLLYISPSRQLLYATDIYSPSSTSSTPSRRFEHLTCFLPGMFALGAHTLSSPSSSLPPHANYSSPPSPDLSDPDLQLHKWAAEGLARSCWTMYADMPSGLGAEIVQFDMKRKNSSPNPKYYKAADADAETTTATETQGTRRVEDRIADEGTGLWMEAFALWNRTRNGEMLSTVTEMAGEGTGTPPTPPGVSGEVVPLPFGTDTQREYRVIDSRYLLRPETIESIYILHRTTRDPIWRERAWQIFLALERHCRQKVGYASLRGVNAATTSDGGTGNWESLNEMPSYALAETFKYLYLIFLDHDPLPMDKWVFNTEAHPFPIFEWTKKEKQRYGI